MNPLVYVAGPYAEPDPVSNTREAIRVGMHLHEATGAEVIIPHLSLLAHMLNPRPADYWYRFGRGLVEHCDALYRLDGYSLGSDIEVDHAIKLDIPVFFDSSPADVKAFKEWVRTWQR